MTTRPLPYRVGTRVALHPDLSAFTSGALRVARAYVVEAAYDHQGDDAPNAHPHFDARNGPYLYALCDAETRAPAPVCVYHDDLRPVLVCPEVPS